MDISWDELRMLICPLRYIVGPANMEVELKKVFVSVLNAGDPDSQRTLQDLANGRMQLKLKLDARKLPRQFK
jgi:hypothetical protein